MLVLDFFEITRDERDQVVGMGFFLRPVDRHQPGRRVFLLGNQPSVRQHGHSGGHAAGDFRRELFVRRIETRIPVPRLDLFALGKQVGVTFPVTHLGSAKVKPLRRLRVITDGHARFFVRWNRPGKSDDYLFRGHLPGLDFFRGGDRMNRQVHGVQLQLLDRFGDGLESDGRPAFDRALLEVRRHVERQMQHVHLAVRRVLAVLGRLERRQEPAGFEAFDGARFRLGAESNRINERSDKEQAKKLFHGSFRCGFISQKILDLTMAGNRLTLPGSRVLIPVVFATVPDEYATADGQLLNKFDSLHAT